jgi:OOP family OmpA-OmpF porin
MIGGVADAPSAQSRGPAPEAVERVDYLTFAQGAVPVAIGGAGARFGASFEHAVRIIDGNAQGFTVVNQAPPDTDTEFTYELPALTTFDRFAVPNIQETPAPSQTFTRLVEVHGSGTSATSGFVLLATATLDTHKTRGLVTELALKAKTPVRWVKLRLAGGIVSSQPRMSLEFSEIIGNGTQAAVQPVQHFTGAWRTMARRLRLTQRGTLVSGCYDRTGDLAGTVTGTILRATGVDRFDTTPSTFILSIAADGSVRGVRSDNRAPVVYYTAAVAAPDTPMECGQPAPPALGCGSIIHGITFDFDSDLVRPDSADVLAELHRGLAADRSSRIAIEGHTSGEGTDAYNLRLSERRAQAVVADLVRRGLAAGRLAAAGLGESRPIASNADENGRAMNRRVEVRCQ